MARGRPLRGLGSPLLLRDYVVGHEPGGRLVPPEAIAPALGGLHARLGVCAVLGTVPLEQLGQGDHEPPQVASHVW
jgi:hypothetical protein